MKRTICLAAVLALLAGCEATHKSVSSMPVLTPPPVEQDNPGYNPGSLFDPARADYLFSDNRARRVGDIVLVNIVETTTAKHTAETTADKENTMEFGVTNWFGKDTVRVPGLGALGVKGPTGNAPLIGTSSKTEFEGTGETTRESEVSATVAARVVRVLPGGLMQVEGGREVRVNDETQILVVRGLVRASDVGPDNSVTSTKLADAKIEYYGKGVLADKQRPGWLSRILDNIWPF